MQIQNVRSFTVVALLKKLFSPHDPCQFKGTFPRRVARIHRIIETEQVRIKPCPDRNATDVCDAQEPKAWPYDTALPSGLPPISEMPAARPDLMAYRHPPLPPQRSPLSDKNVDVLI
jgi:hypothetical protein